MRLIGQRGFNENRISWQYVVGNMAESSIEVSFVSNLSVSKLLVDSIYQCCRSTLLLQVPLARRMFTHDGQASSYSQSSYWMYQHEFEGSKASATMRLSIVHINKCVRKLILIGWVLGNIMAKGS